jgi:hypothetical protein
MNRLPEDSEHEIAISHVIPSEPLHLLAAYDADIVGDGSK